MTRLMNAYYSIQVSFIGFVLIIDLPLIELFLPRTHLEWCSVPDRYGDHEY